METTYNHIRGWAYQRGFLRGKDDEYGGFYNPSPLSGEWAGESPEELLGDLFRKAYALTMDFPPDDLNEIYAELMDDYERGYQDGNNYTEDED